MNSKQEDQSIFLVSSGTSVDAENDGKKLSEDEALKVFVDFEQNEEFKTRLTGIFKKPIMYQKESSTTSGRNSKTKRKLIQWARQKNLIISFKASYERMKERGE